ncbi:MAG: tRNA 2-thiouridine(34) synthase MnmA [bacterium]|nr:tRNA 2-thiouridine(34) synthase MnmA [bacterium]
MKDSGDKTKKRVAVAMSGGVDSSAAALILKREGYDVIGISMKLLSDELSGKKGGCCSLEDFNDARRVADILDVPYYVLNMQKEFSDRVIASFVTDYSSGKTPNPCILCNQEMKFDLLMKKAAQLGADYLATGHYARVDYDDKRGRYILKKGLDATKDQSYFLFSMTQDQLSKTLFPVGSFCKDEIRDMLRDAGISIADKDESQDICFVDDGDYSTLIEKSVDKTKPGHGDIVSEDGRILGTHDGIHNYTIGQRRGLGISSLKRQYVLGLDLAGNRVIVGDEEGLLSGGLMATSPNWISIEGLKGELEASVKIRYSLNDHKAILSPQDEGSVKIRFLEKVRAVTPGQAVVFYDGEEVIGGGWIERAIK